MANSSRGEMEIEIGGKVRTLVFRTREVMILEELLGKDVLLFISKDGGQTKFLVDAVFAGLSQSANNEKINLARVAGWFDNWEGDRLALRKEILFAIARGRPGEEGKEYARVLDEIFGPQADGVLGEPKPDFTSGG